MRIGEEESDDKKFALDEEQGIAVCLDPGSLLYTVVQPKARKRAKGHTLMRPPIGRFGKGV